MKRPQQLIQADIKECARLWRVQADTYDLQGQRAKAAEARQYAQNFERQVAK